MVRLTNLWLSERIHFHCNIVESEPFHARSRAFCYLELVYRPDRPVRYAEYQKGIHIAIEAALLTMQILSQDSPPWQSHKETNCCAPKTIFFFPLVFFFFSFLVSIIFWTFLYYTNPPSQRAKINSVNFAYTVNTSEAGLRGCWAATPPYSPSLWTSMYVLGTLQFYYP